jgi:hypothetical protein
MERVLRVLPDAAPRGDPHDGGNRLGVHTVAMVTDEARQRKLMYQGADLIPRVAVLDPRMTLTLPARLTAATGMDALTHAVESMHSTWHQPMTDGLAMQAIELINTFLPRVFADGGDVFGRMNMLMAATTAGSRPQTRSSGSYTRQPTRQARSSTCRMAWRSGSCSPTLWR